ncbi:MAG: asparagine synthase (glutamine-hydrolyzing) [Campylobacterales bacterium]|nr:asparagine synthase (glutamine-hydrolyzing) [Campylobacterales bacterium]
MCGIAGFISKNRDYDAKTIVQKMLDKGVHRGPDQSGLATYGDATIGMVRLSIIDTVEHHIPYEDVSGNFAIVYNGEIYNHEEIRKNLGKYSFKTGSDTETAMVSFVDKGVNAFRDYNGMYAFAVHDKKKNETFIVRDKVGEKPLYYVKGKDFFAFASEIKSLIGLIEPKFNDKAVSYKAYEFTTGKETLFKDVYLLEPGEYIHVKNGKASIKSYWKIWDNLIELPDDENKIVSSLAELVEDSILLRTKNCAHSFGAFVSGGIDSSLVACIAKPDHLYTAHYDYDDFNELDYARLVAKQIKKELIVVEPNKEDFLRTREQIAYHLDTPCTWTSFTLWMLLERVKKDGVKVMMAGDGADEVFGGYHRYHLLHHDEQIHALDAMKQYSYLINRYYGSPVDRYTKLVNRCENPYDTKVLKFLNESIGFYFDKMQKDVVHAMGLNDFYSTMQVLLQMADRLSMAFSIENRSPFLDYRLVQFAFSMSSKYKIKGGITKWALKEVARKFIPKEICDRIDKRGFSAPVNKWFEWDKKGKYNRDAYKNMVLDDWKKVYGVKGV